ncbi:hypothetical protein ACJ5NV_04995 [Loktanella agnita]|uniref:hypothetical protein n=1 Tax=Loktanella agnita TaxID=287097 RepID=UPI0039884365
MITAATELTELFLSCGALLGLLTLQNVLLRRDGWDPINRRFLFCIRVMMLLFAGRVLTIVPGLPIFRVMVLLGAALLPLAALLMTEGLLRRHAPPWLKIFVGAGTVIFTVSAFWYSDSIDPLRTMALLCFQMAGFVLAGCLIIMRDRKSLSVSENVTVTRLGWSLALFIPMAFGDFMLIYIGLPIQFSALSVLILCWLAIGLGRTHLGHRATLMNLFVMVAAATVVGTMIGFFGTLGRDGTLLSIASIMTVMFLVAIFNDARTLRLEEQSWGLLRHMATARTDDPLIFLRGLRSHPLVEGAVVVSEKSLHGLQTDVLHQIFAASPVLRKSEPPALGPVAEDHITYLFERYSATHIMLASGQPLVLIALSMPSLSASPNAELELQVVQRMAGLIARQR